MSFDIRRRLASMTKAGEHLSKPEQFLSKIAVTCCYQLIKRVTQPLDSYDDDCDNKWGYKGKCLPLKNRTTIIKRSDGVVVRCNFKRNQFYINVHHLIVKMDGNQLTKTKQTLERALPKGLNVIMFGTDSVSRSTFLRSNPKSHRYLVKDLKALDFAGYTKVGDNTLSNWVPFLTGKSLKEMTADHCYKSSVGAKTSTAKKFDDCPYVWKEFKRNGYVTALIEDRTKLSAFNYKKAGFVNPPTDHYVRPTFMASEELIGHTDEYVCQGSKFSLQIIHDYSLNLLKTYANESTFSLFWSTSMTHGTLSSASSADLPHLSYLKSLKKSGALNRSILFFFSDHGLRFGEFRETLMGKVEESLPYLFIVVPDWFKRSFPEAAGNLEKNTRVLVTPFDLYPTLLDLANPSYLNESYVEANPLRRSVSLFKEISSHRSCVEAEVPEQYCSCQEYVEMESDGPMSSGVAQYLKTYLNRMLQPFPACAPIKKVTVQNIFSGKKESKQFNGIADLILSVQARYFPGAAVIDATLFWKENDRTQPFQISGDISRINAYGNQSHCVRDSNVAKFCICNDML